MIALDKQAHLLAGAAIASTCVAYGLLPLYAFALGVAAGAAKEIIDHFGFGQADKWDFIATAVGAGVVLPLV